MRRMPYVFFAGLLKLRSLQIILYYFRGKGRRKGDMELELEYQGFFYIKLRVEGETAWRSGQSFFYFLYHCISVAIFHCS